MPQPRILTAVATLAGGEIAARAAAFGATAILARRLGPEAFGVIGFAAAICGYLALAVNSGLQEVGTRAVARDPARASAMYSSVATTRLLIAVGALIILAAVVWWLPKPGTVKLVVLLSGLSFFSLAIDPVWVLKGLERPVAAALNVVLAQVVYASAVVVLIQGPESVGLVPVLQFAGELCAALLFGAVVMRRARPSWSATDALQVLRSARYLGLARVLRTIVITFDVVLLGFLATNYDLGLYSAAYRLTFLLMAVAAAISSAYLPSYARVAGTGAATIRHLLETSLEAAVLVGAPLVAGAVALAPALLTVVFGAEYAGAAPAFRLLALSIGAPFLYWMCSNLLIVADRTRLYATICGLAAALNIALNLVLIPRWGITGAAAATLCSEAAIAVTSALVLMQMDVMPSLVPIIRPLAAASVMASVVWVAAARLHVLPVIALGALVYGAVLGVLGGLRQQRLAGLASGRPNPS